MTLAGKKREQTLSRRDGSRFASRVLVSAALFAIIPLLFFLAVAQLTKAKGPQWLPYTFENPYHYLFNSLLLLKGQPSPYTIHPGTTTLTFGAIILRASSLKSTDDLVEYSLRNPEKQIKALHRALLVFTALILWIAPWITALALRNYIAALLIQAPALFYQSLLYWGMLFGPDLMIVGFSIAVVCGCVLLLVPSTVSEQRIVLGLGDRSTAPASAGWYRIPIAALISGLVWVFGLLVWENLFGPQLMNIGLCAVAVCWLLLMLPFAASEKTLLLGVTGASAAPGSSSFLRVPLVAFITGLLCALGVVTKLIFFPLILISLLCCRTPRNLASFGVAFVLGLILAVAPIYPALRGLIISAFNLGVRSQPYGGGPVGLPQTSIYLQTLSDFFQTEPLLVIIPIATAIVVIALSALGKQNHAHEVSWRTVLPVFALQLVAYLVIAKEVYARYLFPLCLSVGLNLVLLFYVLRTSGSKTKRIIGFLALLGLLLLGFRDFVELTPRASKSLRQDQIEQVRLYKYARDVTKDDVRIDYFFSDSPEYPLFSANQTTGHAFSSLLARMYPHAPLFFNYSSGKLETFTETLDPEVELQKYDHLYLLGDRDQLPKLPGLDQGELKTIYQADTYSLDEWRRK